MASVRAWAALQGYEYEFVGDEIFELCGADYLAQVGDNKRSITNLARLELIRQRLAGAYERAIWLDADTFVFAPDAFRMDIAAGYAFAREVWVARDGEGVLVVEHRVHNASCVFTRGQPDLDFLIGAARYIAATRQIEASFQVGVRLISGLQYPLSIPLLQDSGIFSPDIMHALATGDDGPVATLVRGHAHPLHAGNLCFSQLDADDPRSKGVSEQLVMTAMDRLEQSGGAVMNRFLSPPSAAAADGSITTRFLPRAYEIASLQINSPTWLIARALRELASRNLPVRLKRALRRVLSANR
jgi:hypothetical protein